MLYNVVDWRYSKYSNELLKMECAWKHYHALSPVFYGKLGTQNCSKAIDSYASTKSHVIVTDGLCVQPLIIPD